MTEAEFRTAFHLNKDVLYRFAFRMTGSGAAAEDLVQDCFLTLWKDSDRFDPDRGPLRSFLLGVTRNLALKRLRKERPHESIDNFDAAVPPVDLADLDRPQAVAAAVKALPALQREALILAEYEELSLEEIARVTGVETGTIKSRLHRARENLRRTLAPLLQEGKGTSYGF